MKNVWQNLKASYCRFEKQRLDVIILSRQIKIGSKKLIHKSLNHRIKNNLEQLKKIKKMVNQLMRMLDRNPWLYQIGALNEGLEEYSELVFLTVYLLDDQKVLKYLPSNFSHDALIGGIADASGELIRLVRMQMDIKEAEKVHQYISNLYEQFLDLEIYTALVRL